LKHFTASPLLFAVEYETLEEFSACFTMMTYENIRGP